MMIHSSSGTPSATRMEPAEGAHSFNPHGLSALLVDHNPTSLFLLSKLFRASQYHVTPCSCPTEALTLIKNGEIKFDIVITEVNFSPDFNGTELLEIIIRETDLPVVVVSADDRIQTIRECVMKGACAFLPKPVRMEVIQVIWQHVARKEMFRFKPDHHKKIGPGSSNSGEDQEFCGSSDGVPVDYNKVNEQDHTAVQHKKQRLVWTDGLHQKFLHAVRQLGIHDAVPKKVLELMNVPGLKRENVASHLQKYRLNLRKQTVQQAESFTIQNSITPVQIGARGSVIGHNVLCPRTPPSTYPFHDPDHSV